MSVKFRSPLELSAHRAIAHSDAAQTLEVTVAAKTAAHPEFGNGSANGYIIDGVEGAYLEFTPGNTYKFDQSDSSNTGHPLRFYEDAAKTTAYTTGVTTAGTPGSAGAYTQIIPTTSTNPILYYQCSAHSLMGSYAKFGTGSQGDTYTLSASQDGDNVDILLDAGSGTDSTVQLTAGNNITLTRSSAQEIEIASSGGGGGGGTVTVEKNVYTANGSTTTFNTTTAIVSENNVQVYIDGVYQSKDNYTTSGSTVTFSTAPPNTASVELIHMVAVSGVIARDSFTGNGSTTAYVLSMSITNEVATQVYIDGVYQSKNNYTTSGSTLTFSTAPPNGAAIEVVHIKAVNPSSLNKNVFTGDGSTTGFTLSQSIDDENKTFVFIQGVYQEKSVYSINETTLTFSTAPQNGYSVEVMAFDSITIEKNSVTIDNFNGDGSNTGFALSTTPINENVIDVYINGLYQQKNTFSLSGNTLTFSTAPPNNSTIEIKGLGNVLGTADTSTSVIVIASNTTAIAGTLYVFTASLALTLPEGVVGKSIKISNRSGVATCTIVPNGSEKIMGSASTLTLDTAAASFELIYSGSAQGWVIIGQ